MRRRDHEEIVEAWERRFEEMLDVIGQMRQELEAERAYSRRLLEQVAGIYSDIVPDPTDPVTSAARDAVTAAVLYNHPPMGPQPEDVQVGPLPRTPVQWAMPEDPDPATFEDPIDLNQPWDALPVEMVTEQWGMDEQVPLAEPVPEGQREKIVGIAVGEDPFAELGIKRDDL